MPLGCWLSLVPTTDELPCSSSPVSSSPSPSSSSSSSTTTSPTRSSDSYESTSSSSSSSSPTNNSLTTPATTSSCFIPFKKASTPHQHHKHDHHPTPNSFLKPMVLESPNSARPRRNKSSASSSSFHPLPLLENSNHHLTHLNQKHTRSCFEVRSLQVCDIEKVRELHCATLPVTYPSSFFYDLLRSDSQEKISLVATLPSTSVQGYFEVLSSLGNHPGSHLVSSSTSHHGHLTHHHVTSPLSGRKPISLDVVGTITARIPPGPTAPSVRILTLCVSPSYRRFGVGRLLLDSLLKQIKNRFARLLPLNKPLSNPSIQSRIIVNLHVQATNKVAYAFYLRAGFSPVCFKPAYYSDNDLKPLDPALKRVSSSSSLRKSSSLELHSSLLSSFNPSSLSHQQTLLSQPDPPSTVNSDSDESVDVDAWFLELSLDCS